MYEVIQSDFFCFHVLATVPCTLEFIATSQGFVARSSSCTPGQSISIFRKKDDVVKAVASVPRQEARAREVKKEKEKGNHRRDFRSL